MRMGVSLAMLKFMYRELYVSSLVSRDSIDNVNVFIKTIYTIAAIVVALAINNVYVEALLLLYPLSSILIIRSYRVYYHSVRAALAPAFIVSMIILVFSRLDYSSVLYSLTVFLRIVVIASTVLIYMSTTNPFHLAYLVEKIGFPRWIVISIILVWRLIPSSIEIASESYSVALLKKDSLWRMLVSSTITLFGRAEGFLQTLYMVLGGSREYSLKPLVSRWSRGNTLFYTLYSTTVLAIAFILASF